MQSTSREKLQEAIDNALNKTPGLNRFGQDARDQRGLQRDVKYGFESADNTAASERTLKGILTGNNPHLIDYRPTEGVDKLEVAEQKKVFDANLATRKEGDPVVVEKKALETVHDLFGKQMDKVKVPKAKWEVTGVKKLRDNSTTAFEKSDYFDTAKVKELVDLSVENTGEFTGRPPVIVDNLGANADKLIEGMYGSDFLAKLNTLLDQRLAKTTGSSDTTVKAVKDLVNASGLVAPYDITEIRAAKLIKEAVKVSLLRHPESAVDNITKLANDGEIDLFSLDGMKSTLQERALKEIVDRYAESYVDYFNPITGGNVTKADAISNRQAIANQLKNGGLTTLTLKNNSGTTPLTTIPHLWNQPQFTQINGADLKVSAAATTDQQAAELLPFKEDAYQGLYKGLPAGTTTVITRFISKALSKNQPDSATLFKSLVAKGVITASTETDDMKRLAAFASMRREIVEKTSGTLTGTAKSSLERVASSMNEFGSPEEVFNGLKSQLLQTTWVKINAGVIASSPLLTGLNRTALNLEINEALKENILPTSLFEKLSTLVAGVSDENLKAELLNNLRALATVEIINETAAQAAGSDTSVLYDQHAIALLNKFIMKGGSPAPTAEQLVGMLNDLMYGKGTADTVLKLDINGNPSLNNYLTSMHGGGVTYVDSLELKGQASSGAIYARAHEVLGIIRRGSELGEWAGLMTKGDPEKTQYLIDNFGLTAGSQELIDALGRFNQLFATAAAGSLGLQELFKAAAENKSTDFGSRYTNIERMFRHYILQGGELKEIMKNWENIQVNKFINSVQKDANAQLGTQVGSAMTENNRVLTVEEQRNAILGNYEALSGKNGIKAFFQRLKTALPRVAKAAAFMVAGFALGAVPVLAGPAAIGFAVLRVVGAVTVLKKGIPMIREAWNKGDTKVMAAAGLGIGVNVLVQTLFPSPLNMGLTLLGETVGTVAYEMRGLKEEAKMVLKAHTVYETAWKTFLGTTASDDQILKVAKSLNVPPVMAGTTLNKTATVAAIIAKRDTAHTEKNMTLLRSFSEVMEDMVTVQAQNVLDTNKKARELYEESQKTIMAYALASSATKIFGGMTRGYAVGSEDGGFVGGLFGALGIQDISTVFDWDQSITGDDVETEVGVPTETMNTLQENLEAQFDAYAKANGIAHEGTNVIGIVEDVNGHQFIMVDTNGNLDNVEHFLPVNNVDLANPTGATIDFGGNYSVTETGEGVVDSRSTYETQTITDIQSVAESGDSQWSLIEDVVRQANPGISDSEAYRYTANIINEAGTGGVYQQVYEHRDISSGGAIRIGDRLTLEDIKEMAPNNYARLQTAAGSNFVTTSTTATATVVGQAPDLSAPLATESGTTGFGPLTGMYVFSNGTQDPTLLGSMTFVNSAAVVTDDGTGQGTTTLTDDQTDTDTQTPSTDTDEESLKERLSDFLFGDKDKPQTETETGGVSPEVQFDTVKVEDYDINEELIQKVVIKAPFEGMAATEIDPKSVDLVSITQNKVVYIDGSGVEQTVQAYNGITLQVAGSELNADGTAQIVDVDVRQGQNTFLSSLNDKVIEARQDTDRMVTDMKDLQTNIQELNNNLYQLDETLKEITHYEEFVQSGNQIIDRTSEVVSREVTEFSQFVNTTSNNIWTFLERIMQKAQEPNSTGFRNDPTELQRLYRESVPEGNPISDSDLVKNTREVLEAIAKDGMKRSPLEQTVPASPLNNDGGLGGKTIGR